jgi:putative ABC transport system ATP-binding protein
MKATESDLYRANGLSFEYHLDGQNWPALRGVSLAIRAGEFACLSGPSGSGKTTLLNILGLIEPIQGGEVLFGKLKLSALTEREKNEIRRHRIGFVFQSFQLFPVLSAEENVEYFLTRQGLKAPERKRRVREALESVGVWEHRAKRPLQMSGGQRQRVAVARALAKKPEVILADEPTASLDQETGRLLMETFRDLKQKFGITLIVSSHDSMVHRHADRVIRLLDGRMETPDKTPEKTGDKIREEIREEVK